MLKKLSLLIFVLSILGACGNKSEEALNKAGLLVIDTVNDQVWGTLGYKGMLKIQDEFGTEVYYHEGVVRKSDVEKSVRDLNNQEVQLIFGHGNEYAAYFNQIAPDYPHIHFVSFNGEAKMKNTTSISFDAHAMGFFAGMTASHVTKSNQLGIIAVHSWQPEIKGFLDGATFQNPDVQVTLEHTGDWNNSDKAFDVLDRLLAKDVDIIYPAGDAYSIPVIGKLKEKGLYAIGYGTDQSDLGETTVLTSTVQHVDMLYELVAKKYKANTLEQGNISVDFQDGVISIGKFSPHIDQAFKEKISTDIETYISTNELPK